MQSRRRSSYTDQRSLYLQLWRKKKIIAERYQRNSGNEKDNKHPLLDRSIQDLTAEIEEGMTRKNKRVRKFCKDLAEASTTEDCKLILSKICNELGVVLERDPSFWTLETLFSWFRIGQAFFLMSAFAILLSLSTGLMMEQFFTIVGGSRISSDAAFSNVWWKTGHFLGVAWLPIGMMILAMIGDHMCDLIMDSLDFPPFHRFQASWLAYLSMGPEKPDLDLETVRRVDRYMLCLFEGVPLLVGAISATIAFIYLGDRDVRAAGICTLLLECYLQASILAAFTSVAIFIWCNFRLSWSKASSEELKILHTWISNKIDQKKMRPYCLHAGFQRVIEDEKPQDGLASDPRGEQEESGTPGPVPTLSVSLSQEQTVTRQPCCSRVLSTVVDRYAKAFAACAFFLWTTMVLFFLFWPAGFWHSIVLASMLVVTVVFCTHALRKNFKKFVGAPYTLILIANVTLGSALFSFSKCDNPLSADMGAIMSVNPENLPAVHSGLPAHWTGAAPPKPRPYPICDMSWGSPGAPLRVLDLVNLAWIIYDQNSTEHMKEMLSNSFHPKRQAQLVNATDYESIPRWGHFYFPGSASPEGGVTRGTRVIAVKGTSTRMDALLDTNLFSTVKLLQWFGMLLPVLQILPRWAIQYLLQGVHLPTIHKVEQSVWKGLESYVREQMAKYPEDTFVMTGHSLGGGLAQVVAASIDNISAVVWSAPGVAYSAKLFGVEVQAVKRSVVSVVPDHDVVPNVDLQAGTLQHIECRDKSGKEDSAFNCHSLVKTACEVWRVCGDDRDFRRSCSSKVNPTDLGRLFSMDDYIGN